MSAKTRTAKNKNLSEAMKGNKNAVGNNGGCPRIFETPEDLEKKCDSYFDWADSNPWYKNEALKGGDRAGEIISIPMQRPYTLKGLCLFLEITTNCWRDYEERAEFINITTRVRERIDNQQFEGGMVGVFNANLSARRLGMIDKTEQKVVLEQPLFKLKDVPNNNID
ncbi:terminase small subunit [Aquimarina hainanensis]|uniref:Terminase small subunit n=1 Tax=Aquimarina hainanensis TaxID=1578017 RepID=A0ABW5NB48_9FLAO